MQFILSHSYFLFSHYVLPKILNGSQKSVQLHYYSTQQICFILENRENFIPFILYHWCSFSMLSNNLHCPSLLFMTDKIIVSQNSYLITISVTCSKFEHNVPGFAQIIFFCGIKHYSAIHNFLQEMHVWKQTHEKVVHQCFNFISFVLSLCAVALPKGFNDMFKDTTGTH